jgi:ParB/RepB/Spo0J family partition protein
VDNNVLKDLGELQLIPMKELFIDHDFNHRGRVVPIDVAEFARAIDRDGLKTPIVVQRINDPAHPQFKFRVVSGHRRAMAFTVLKREAIPGFVKFYATELEAKTDSLIENIHRKDLNIKQEAHALVPFIKAYWSENDISEHLNQSRGWVKIRMMLLDLPEKVQDYCAAGLLTQEHIRMLHGKTENQQLEFIREVKEAKARGEKLTIEKPVKKTNPFLLKPRGREEIFEKIMEVSPIIGFGIWSRALSWAAGQISEYDFMKEIEKWAIDNGHPYRVPNEMLLQKMGA